MVHHDLQAVGVLRQLGKVLLRAVERAERVVVPDVPADHDLPPPRLRALVEGLVGLPQAVVPEVLPRQQFRVLEQQPPEGDMIAVDWPLSLARGADEARQFAEACLHAREVDSPFLPLSLAELAET